MSARDIRRYREIAGLEPENAFVWWEHSVFPAEAKAAIDAGLSPQEAREAAQQRLRQSMRDLREVARQMEAGERLRREQQENAEREREIQRELERARERQEQMDAPETRARREKLRRRLLANTVEASPAVDSIAASDSISVTQWSAQGSDPTVAEYVCLPDGKWQCLSAPTQSPRALADILSVPVVGALHVRALGRDVNPSALAGALPCSVEYLMATDELETGDNVLDDFSLGLV